jgi:hypothetical protein
MRVNGEGMGNETVISSLGFRLIMWILEMNKHVFSLIKLYHKS